MFRWIKIVFRWPWEVRDTLLELVIIAMIGWEIHEGNLQYDLLDKMNANIAGTATAIEKLREERSSCSFQSW